MNHRIQPTTPQGSELIQIAEEHAADFATRAAAHDRDGSYPFENIEALRSSGYLYSPFPADCGGLGTVSVHDVVVAASRLAEGDPSTTIGSNMHLIGMLGLRRAWSTAAASGREATAAALLDKMGEVARERRVYAAAVSEINQDLSRPATTAVRHPEGWSITGKKIFGTMSPAATHFNVAVTYTDDNGVERYAFAEVPSGAPGITLHDDWDPLGMRASGSGSISFNDVVIERNALGKGFPAGEMNAELLENFLVSGAMHAASSHGIAEAAMAELVRGAASGQVRSHGASMGDRPVVQMIAAEMTVDLVAMRGTLSRSGKVIDDYYCANRAQRGSVESVEQALADVQAAKVFLNAASVRVVDHALTACGGGAFMNRHPLSRLYRDARAGGFMNPFQTSVAYELIGRSALGKDLNLK